MSRRARVVGAGIAGASLLGAEWLRRAYAADIGTAYRRLDTTETTLVETSAGTVEYHATGNGVPVLISHGIVGGFDQGLTTGRNLFGDDAEVVGVSRYGYL